ncbi:hypothetical protein SSM1_048 [Synechococcus phage S-SM1]|jgi:hypothetical protein|uniref:Uncharacterized protein n=1 Tax=Synechococcus phage S-SM1 TaxID=444859 RepID=E3SI55_9CAUD|nr:hypothetical protein SSM1_048 [Synechococcus phage S-SM1]ADO97302.1 hypothetical protein SSM1_048 [Synechococcus phage S-SM1]
MAAGKLTVTNIAGTPAINLPVHDVDNLPKGTVGDLIYVKTGLNQGTLYCFRTNPDTSVNEWVALS